MIEDYVFPGGLMAAMKRMNPAFAPFVNVPAAAIFQA